MVMAKSAQSMLVKTHWRERLAFEQVNLDGVEAHSKQVDRTLILRVLVGASALFGFFLLEQRRCQQILFRRILLPIPFDLLFL